MAVGGDLAAAVEIVQEDVLFGERVMIRSHFPAEKNEAGIAIAFRNSSEYLVVGAVFLDDVDAVFNQAVSEGATALYPVRDQFYGDRSGYLRDPFGHLWSLATHKKDLSLDEIKKAGEAYFEEMSKTKTGMR